MKITPKRNKQGYRRNTLKLSCSTQHRERVRKIQLSLGWGRDKGAEISKINSVPIVCLVKWISITVWERQRRVWLFQVLGYGVLQGIVLVDNRARLSLRTGVGDSTTRLYVGGFRHKISLEHLAPIVEGLEIKKPHRSWSMHGESAKTKRSHFTP